MYWPLRLSLGIRGGRKRKKKAPTHWRGIVVDDETGQEDSFEIEVGKFPRFYVTVEMPPPGIINDLPPTDKSPELKLYLKADQEGLKAFVESLGASSYEIGFNWRWDAFNQLLAKIAHAYSAGLAGFDGIEYLLPPLIVGGSACFSYLIGGIDDPSQELEPPADIQLNYRKIRDELYLSVKTTIFGNKRFPTYEIISGRIIDLDMVRRKIAVAQERIARDNAVSRANAESAPGEFLRADP
jgi:hypothetical protein